MFEDRESNSLVDRIYRGERISTQEARALFEWGFVELGTAGDMRRRLASPKAEVGFIVDRIINFTNICEAGCEFCAFHAGAKSISAYELTIDNICKKVEGLQILRGTQVMLQGGLHPNYTLDTYLAMVRTIKSSFPDIYLHSFSPAELMHISQKEAITLDEVISALKNAGLDSVPGASDLLVDRIRKRVSPKKLTKDEWCEVMRALCRHGIKSSATMTYGMGECIEERIEHLKVIRDIQDETGIIRAFIPWSFSPVNTCLDNILPATGIEYLQMVSISRIFLDNIKYIQAGWLTEGLKLAQIALAMGANDMGGVLMEEVVVKATGIKTKTNIPELINIIKNAGRVPVQRDSEYNAIRSF
ncbi:MAG: CofH family radical SAM protein [Spirochaetota bacterium]|nr:CofH family radical SAM protein [Spirochaetota bacterium]